MKPMKSEYHNYLADWVKKEVRWCTVEKMSILIKQF